MRRVLFLILLGVPVLAFGQSTGKITFSDDLLGLAQCMGVQSSDPPVGEAQQLTIAWTIQPLTNVTFGPGGTITIVASTVALQAEGRTGTEATSCAKVNTTDPTPGEVSTLDDIPVGSATGSVRVSASALLAAVLPGCGGATRQTVHLCIEWRDSAANASGWATGTVQFEPRTPGAPSNPRVTGGDRSIRVTGCTPGSDNTQYIARASADGFATRYSNQSSSCGDLRITDLVNDTPYTVVVFGLNQAGNSSPPSNSVTGTPVPTDDFWDEYQQHAGAEQGGCNTGAGAAGALAALSLIAAAAAARRRKP